MNLSCYVSRMSIRARMQAAHAQHDSANMGMHRRSRFRWHISGHWRALQIAASMIRIRGQTGISPSSPREIKTKTHKKENSEGQGVALRFSVRPLLVHHLRCSILFCWCCLQTNPPTLPTLKFFFRATIALLETHSTTRNAFHLKTRWGEHGQKRSLNRNPSCTLPCSVPQPDHGRSVQCQAERSWWHE